VETGDVHDGVTFPASWPVKWRYMNTVVVETTEREIKLWRKERRATFCKERQGGTESDDNRQAV
jgi:hypothetical protein